MDTQTPAIDLPEQSPSDNSANFQRDDLPSLVSRIKAIFADFLIMLLVFALSSTIIDAVGGASPFVRGTILIFMIYLYDPLFTCLYGGTIGHRILGLRVAKYDYPEQRISIVHACVRSVVKYLLGWVSFFTVTANDDKRAIHDLASGSILLKR